MSFWRRILSVLLAAGLLGALPAAASFVCGGAYSRRSWAMPGQTVECRASFSVPGGREYVIRTRFSSGVSFAGLRSLQTDGQDVNAAFFTLLDSGRTAEIRLASRFSESDLTQLEIRYAVRTGDGAVCLPALDTYELELSEPGGSPLRREGGEICCCVVTVFRGVSVPEAGRQSNPLPGACFSLYRDRELTKRVAFTYTGGSTYLACTAQECPHSRHAFLLRTREDGLLRLEGLTPGVWYLQESRTPQGFRSMANALEIRISPEGEITAEGVPVQADVVTLSEPSSVAPAEKEERDPLAFYTSGCRVLAAGLAVLLLERRRLFR